MLYRGQVRVLGGREGGGRREEGTGEGARMVGGRIGEGEEGGEVRAGRGTRERRDGGRREEVAQLVYRATALTMVTPSVV